MSLPKIAVVTGANKGIGLSIVKLLCQQRPDWVVYLTARDVGRGEKAVADLKSSFNITPRFHQLDVEKTESCQAFKEHLAKEHPQGISALINNAGYMFKSGPDGFKFDREIIRKTVSINYFGVVNVCQALFPILAPGARVVLVSSRIAQVVFSTLSTKLQERLRNCVSVEELSNLMAEYRDLPEDKYHLEGWSPVPLHEFSPKWRLPSGDLLPYGLTKMGLNLLTAIYQMQFDAASETGESSTVVNACTPGMVLTDMNKTGTKTPDEGADVPVLLALLPENTQLRGIFMGDTRQVEDLFKL